MDRFARASQEMGWTLAGPGVSYLGLVWNGGGTRGACVLSGSLQMGWRDPKSLFGSLSGLGLGSLGGLLVGAVSLIAGSRGSLDMLDVVCG